MSVYSATIPLLANTIGSNIPLMAANFAFLAEAIAQEHGWDADDATAMVHTSLMKPAYGLLSERPATGKSTDWYYSTDTASLAYGTGDGGAWNEISITSAGPAHATTHEPGGTDDLYASSYLYINPTTKNVGIGTTSPAEALQVGSVAGGIKKIDVQSSVLGSFVQIISDGTYGALFKRGAGSLYVGTTSSTGILFQTDNVVRATISSTGIFDVVGEFTAGTKTFLIDHPVEPTEKTLTHAVFEGPEHGLIYRGKTKLVNGKATINLDTYFGMTDGTFKALTQDVVVQSLQNQDGFDRCRPSNVTDNSFDIICENASSTDEIAWVVMAARADRLVKSSDQNDSNGRLILENDKKESDTDKQPDINNYKGYYRNFEAFGKSKQSKG